MPAIRCRLWRLGQRRVNLRFRAAAGAKARAEARARASRQGASSIRRPSWRSATTSPASGRTRRSVALKVGPRVSSKHDHHQCRYRYHWLLVWFIPQPVLTLPSTSMRGNLALFTLLVCRYCHGASFAPSPRRLGGDAIVGSLSLRVAVNGR